MTRRKPSQKQTCHRLEITDEVKALISSILPLAQDEELKVLTGWRDGAGNLRRARALFNNGWTADMFFRLPRDGKQSLSSYRLNWHGTVKKAAA